VTTAQHYIPGRRWSRASAPFATRLEGANRSRKVWVCPACRRWHNPERRGEGKRPGRPVACRGCGEKQLLFFDSTGEAQHFMRLWLLQDHDRVRGLKHHPRFALVCPARAGGLHVVGHYEADVEYEERDRAGEWQHFVEDFKPKSEEAQDPLFKWKRRHVEAQYGIRIRIVS